MLTLFTLPHHRMRSHGVQSHRARLHWLSVSLLVCVLCVLGSSGIAEVGATSTPAAPAYLYIPALAFLGSDVPGSPPRSVFRSLCAANTPLRWDTADTPGSGGSSASLASDGHATQSASAADITVGDVFTHPALRGTLSPETPLACVDRDATYVVLYFCPECETLSGIASLRDALTSQVSVLAARLPAATGKNLTVAFAPYAWVQLETVQRAIAVSHARHIIFFSLTNETVAVAAAMPEYNFTVLNAQASVPASLPNTEILMLPMRDMGFEAGALAGQLARSGAICTVAEDSLLEVMLGIHAGVEHTCAECKLANIVVSTRMYEDASRIDISPVLSTLKECGIIIVADQHSGSPVAQMIARKEQAVMLASGDLKPVICVMRSAFTQSSSYPRVANSVMTSAEDLSEGVLSNALGNFTRGVRYVTYGWTGVSNVAMTNIEVDEFNYMHLLYRNGALNPTYGAMTLARKKSSTVFIDITSESLGLLEALSPSWSDEPIVCNIGQRVVFLAGDLSSGFIYSAETNEFTPLDGLVTYDLSGTEEDSATAAVGSRPPWTVRVPPSEVTWRRGASCTEVTASSAVIHGGVSRDGVVTNETFVLTFAAVGIIHGGPCDRCTVPQLGRLPLRAAHTTSGTVLHVPRLLLYAPLRHSHGAFLRAETVSVTTAAADAHALRRGGSVELRVGAHRRNSAEPTTDSSQRWYLHFINGYTTNSVQLRGASSLDVTALVAHSTASLPSWEWRGEAYVAPYSVQEPSTVAASAPCAAGGSGCTFQPLFVGYVQGSELPVWVNRGSGRVYELKAISNCNALVTDSVLGYGVVDSASSSADSDHYGTSLPLTQCYQWEATPAAPLENVSCATLLGASAWLSALTSDATGAMTLYRYRYSTSTWIPSRNLISSAATRVLSDDEEIAQADALLTLSSADATASPPSSSGSPRVCVGLPRKSSEGGGAFIFPSVGRSVRDTLVLEVASPDPTCGASQAISWDFSACYFCFPGDEAAADGFCQASVIVVAAVTNWRLIIVLCTTIPAAVLGVCFFVLWYRRRVESRDAVWDRACNPKNAPPSGESPIAAVRVSPLFFQMKRWGPVAEEHKRGSGEATAGETPVGMSGGGSSSSSRTNGDVGEDRGPVAPGDADDVPLFRQAVDTFRDYVCGAVDEHKCFLIRFTGDTAMFAGRDPNNVLSAAADLSLQLASLDLFPSVKGTATSHSRERMAAMPVQCGVHYAYVGRAPTNSRSTHTRFVYSGTLAEECSKLMMTARPGVIVASESFYERIDQRTLHSLGIVPGACYDLPLGSGGSAAMGAATPGPGQRGGAKGGSTARRARTQVCDLVLTTAENRFRVLDGLLDRHSPPLGRADDGGVGSGPRTLGVASQRLQPMLHRQRLCSSYLCAADSTRGPARSAGGGDAAALRKSLPREQPLPLPSVSPSLSPTAATRPPDAEGEREREDTPDGADSHERLEEEYAFVLDLARCLTRTMLTMSSSEASKRARAVLADRFQVPLFTQSFTALGCASSSLTSLASRLVAIADVREDVQRLQLAIAAQARYRDTTMGASGTTHTPSMGGTSSAYSGGGSFINSVGGGTSASILHPAYHRRWSAGSATTPAASVPTAPRSSAAESAEGADAHSSMSLSFSSGGVELRRPLSCALSASGVCEAPLPLSTHRRRSTQDWHAARGGMDSRTERLFRYDGTQSPASCMSSVVSPSIPVRGGDARSRGGSVSDAPHGGLTMPAVLDVHTETGSSARMDKRNGPDGAPGDARRQRGQHSTSTLQGPADRSRSIRASTGSGSEGSPLCSSAHEREFDSDRAAVSVYSAVSRTAEGSLGLGGGADYRSNASGATPMSPVSLNLSSAERCRPPRRLPPVEPAPPH